MARSMKQLIETIEELRVKGIGLRSLIRERTQAGLAAARRVGGAGGRPPKLTEDDIEAAKAMLANPDVGVTSNRAPPRRLSRDAQSLHPRRTNREYLRRLRMSLEAKDRTPKEGFHTGEGRRQCARNCSPAILDP